MLSSHPSCAHRSSRASGGGPTISGWLGTQWRVFPRERGWSVGEGVDEHDGVGLPARAGVVRSTFGCCPKRLWSSRASGGGPVVGYLAPHFPEVFPRERGWSADGCSSWGCQDGLPARAGVVRPHTGSRSASPRSSRASGGGPPLKGRAGSSSMVFPRERGWSDQKPYSRPPFRGLPARAGVVRRCGSSRSPPTRSSRASGGGPLPIFTAICPKWVFPRERGWSAGDRPADRAAQGLPARAGVVRPLPGPAPRRNRSSRASGGGPK